MKNLIISSLLAVTFLLGSSVQAFAEPNGGDSIANNLISNIDNEIKTVENEISKNKKDITDVNTSLKNISKEIDDIKEDVLLKQEILDKRTRELYKNNNGTNLYFEAILNSDGVGDLISSVVAITKVINFDKQVMDDLNNTVTLLEEKEDNLQSKKEQLDTLKKKNEDKLIQLEQQRNAKAALNYEVNNINGSAMLDDLGQASGTAQQIIQFGYKYIGYPYVFGANGPDAFDCSSFMQHIFGKFGINLPRVTYDQVKVGSPVDYNNLQPGDLVFTEGSATRPEHVGVYVGGGQMLHASRPGVGIIVGPIYNYKTARRIL